MTLAAKNTVLQGEKAEGRKASSRGPRGDVALAPSRALEAVVDLLPPEIRAERKAQGTRRVLLYSVLGVVVLVVLGAVGAAGLSVAAQASVAEGQARSASLLQQQQAFRSTRLTDEQVGIAKAAQRVAGATEIDWLKYFTLFQATLPVGVAVTSEQSDSASPIAIFQQSKAPLQGPRVATVALAAVSSSLAPVPAWLTALGKVPGVGDAMVDDTTRDATTGLYTIHVTVHLNSDAYDHRFTGKGN